MDMYILLEKIIIGETSREMASTGATTQIITNAVDISAGKNISIVKLENEEIYVAGNNSNGQIGLENNVSGNTLTKLDLPKKIENISLRSSEHIQQFQIMQEMYI